MCQKEEDKIGSNNLTFFLLTGDAFVVSGHLESLAHQSNKKWRTKQNKKQNSKTKQKQKEKEGQKSWTKRNDSQRSKQIVLSIKQVDKKPSKNRRLILLYL